ncbi:DUF4184 family protein [Planosporangium sp. 12N6]|uniref:DUF4184 family protein n=1 Tax=Planosporangium spinosum TaxID=3402278 RepID=UPI003CEAEA6B
MPLTLPTHPVAVIPLKLWRPRWFDGVALVIGAIAPDVAYVADGYGVTIHSHAWHAPLWWALPITLIAVRLVRWAAAAIAVHLPAGGPLALRDYGILATVRHRWHVTTISALLGAISHIGWDAFTHPAVDGGRILFPALHHQVRPGMPWWGLLSTASDLAGFAAATALAVHIGRGRLLRRWHGPPPPTVRRPVAFWSTVALVVTIGLALLPAQPVRLFHDQAVRAMLITGLALLAGAVAVRPRAARTPRRPDESTVPTNASATTG